MINRIIKWFISWRKRNDYKAYDKYRREFLNRDRILEEMKQEERVNIESRRKALERLISKDE